MDFEITGEETQEQLNALLDKVMEVEVSDEPKDALTGDDREGLFSTENEDNNAGQVQNTTGDKQAPTPGAGTEEEEQSQETVKGILAKDGKHVIPYDVLEAERAEKQRITQRYEQQLAEEQRKIDLLTSQIKQAGMTPDPLPEDARISDEQIAKIREDYPEMADALTLMARKYDYLQSQIQEAQPQQQTEDQDNSAGAAALSSVPDLVEWNQSDPDKFAVAAHIDEKLQNDPAWKGKPMTERFAEAARRTRIAFGEAPEQEPDVASVQGEVAQQQAKAALQQAQQKIQQAESSAMPASPSDLGSSVETTDLLTQIANATPAQLQEIMDKMSDIQISELLGDVM